MSAPQVYTEKTLAEFMHDTLSGIGEMLGFIVGAEDAGSYAEQVNSTMLEYDPGLALSEMTDVRRLRILANVQVWRKVVAATAGAYDITLAGSSYKRSDLFVYACGCLAIAESAAWEYARSYAVTVASILSMRNS